MTALNQQDQLRHIRIDTLTQSVRDLISTRANGVASLEDVSSKIKHHAGVIVELRDEQILKLVVLLNQLFTQYVRDDTGRGGEASKVCTLLTSKNPDFVDKISYLDDTQVIDQMRQPTVKAYYGLFRRESTVRVPQIEDFSKCLDFELLRKDLDRSEYILKLPMFFSRKDNINQFNRLNDLLTALSDAVTLQNEKIILLQEKALTVLARGEVISLADKIDLQKAKFTSLGVTIEPLIINTINREWYGNNLSTTIENMGEDITQCLREPISMIVRREELAEGAFINAMNMMNGEGFADCIRTTQTTAKAITDKIQIISDQLTRFSERLQTLPSKSTDGYYNFAIEDIARLISSYSGALYHLLQFVYDLADGLKDGVDNVVLLSENLRTYQKITYQYIGLRKEQKWL